MHVYLFYHLLVSFCLIVGSFGHTKNLTENEMKIFLDNEYEEQGSYWCNKINQANWDYETDINNKEKEDQLLKVTLDSANFDKTTWKTYFEDLDTSIYQSADLKRKLKFLKNLGSAALDEQKLSELTNMTTTMVGIYSTAKVCPYTKQNCDLEKEGLSLEPSIEDRLTVSRDNDELLYLFKAWRDASGAKMRELYKTYVTLSNEAAKANGFQDEGEQWRNDYESPNLVEDVDKIWSEIEPLYNELHTYTLRKLKKQYGDAIDVSDGLIPAHILGNVWAQQWNNIEDILKPFPNASKINLDEALLEHNYTVVKMFDTSNEFYTSLGLLPLEECYDVASGRPLITKPTDGREVLCHASAWDFCDRKDYRIKMCTSVNAEDFETIHHEMGHIEYFKLYRGLPLVYRNGANPGFHEAVGDTIALSVTTPAHLKQIGLIDDFEENEETSINSLMSIALQKIAFLPFGLLIDKWRWDVFAGKVQPEEWNSHWWEYRKKYQKLKPPVPRSDETDFDPGAKFHVAGDSQYIAYFISHIAQFQFYKSLCVEAGQYNPTTKTPPLHSCDFYRSKEAGKKFEAGLSLGFSEQWETAMMAITGQKELTAGPLMEYFDPLYQYLKEENSKP